MLRVQSPLSQDLEQLVYKVIGCCIAVHRALGPGLLENIYARAVAIELELSGIPFARESEFRVTYRGYPLCLQRVDFVVDHRILLELKSVDHLTPVHRAQVFSYLGVSMLPVALLINFNEVVLQDGIKRIIR